MNMNGAKIKPQRELIAQIPTLFTMGNLLCGFLSILNSVENRLENAAWLIIIGTIFDFLDGRIARFTKTSSALGVQLDSLADFITFGVAPCILLYGVGLFPLTHWRVIIALIYVLASAYRLARYNITASLYEKVDFRGLPIPIAALGIVGMFMFDLETNAWGIKINLESLVTPILVVLSWLMVSTIRFGWSICAHAGRAGGSIVATPCQSASRVSARFQPWISPVASYLSPPKLL